MWKPLYLILWCSSLQSLLNFLNHHKEDIDLQGYALKRPLQLYFTGCYYVWDKRNGNRCRNVDSFLIIFKQFHTVSIFGTFSYYSSFRQVICSLSRIWCSDPRSAFSRFPIVFPHKFTCPRLQSYFSLVCRPVASSLTWIFQEFEAKACRTVLGNEMIAGLCWCHADIYRDETLKYLSWPQCRLRVLQKEIPWETPWTHSIQPIHLG